MPLGKIDRKELKRSIMPTPSTTYKIATTLQKTAAGLGLLLMFTTLALEKFNHHDIAMLTGGLVGGCFFLVAFASVLKTFSQP